MKNVLKMQVTGTDCQNNDFSTVVTFRLVPPSEKDYYGNGHYMTVDMPGNNFYVDCRYSGTTDISKLATTWIKHYFGPNAREIRQIA